MRQLSRASVAIMITQAIFAIATAAFCAEDVESLGFSKAVATAWKVSQLRLLKDANIDVAKVEADEARILKLPKAAIALTNKMAMDHYESSAINTEREDFQGKMQQSLDLNLSYSFTDLYKSTRLPQLSGTQIRAQQVNRRLAQRQLEFMVAGVYLDVLSFRRKHAFAIEIEKVHQALFHAAQKRAEGGVLAANQVARIELAYSRAASEVIDAGQDLIQAEELLRTQLNTGKSKRLLLSDVEKFGAELVAMNKLKEGELPQATDSDEVKYRRFLVEANDKKLEQKRMDFYPNLAAFGDYSLIANPNPDEPRRLMAVGLQLNWQTDGYVGYRQFREMAAVERTKLQIEEAMASEAGLEKINELASLLRNGQIMVEKNLALVSIAQKSLDLERSLFDAGHTDIDRLLNTMLEYIAGKNLLLKSVNSYLKKNLEFQYYSNAEKPQVRGLD